MEAIPRATIEQDGISILLLGCLLFVAMAKYFFPLKFRSFSLLVQNNKLFLGRNNESSLTSGFNVLLFSVQVISFSVFLYLLLNTLGASFQVSSYLLLGRIILLHSLFLGIKVLVEKMIAVLFNGDREMTNYHYFKLSYHNFLGILLIPINALLLYAFHQNRTAIIIILSVIALLNGSILLISLRPHTGLISRHPFYFILYLCALEIAPYFVVFKLVGPPLKF